MLPIAGRESLAPERPWVSAQDNWETPAILTCVGSRPQNALLLFPSSGDLSLPGKAFYTSACALVVGWNDHSLEGLGLLVFFAQRSRPHKNLLHTVIVIINVRATGLHGS